MDLFCFPAVFILLNVLEAGAQGSDTSSPAQRKSQFTSPLWTEADNEFVEGAGGAGAWVDGANPLSQFLLVNWEVLTLETFLDFKK